MNLIEAIKRPKKFTFKYWRYRLLHWCFNVNPTSPSDSPLPAFVYTHYCPLFHITNLIALLFPLILAVRLIALVIRGIGMVAKATVVPVFSTGITLFRDLLKALFEPATKKAPVPEKPKPKEISEAKKRAMDLGLINSAVRDLTFDFNYFWKHNHDLFSILTKEEVEFLCETRLAKIIADIETRKKREQALRAFFTKIAAISQVVVKFIMYVLYIGLAVGLTVGTYYAAPAVFSFIKWVIFSTGGAWEDFIIWIKSVFTVEVITTIMIVISLLLSAVVLVALLVFAAFKIRLGSAIAQGCQATAVAFTPIFVFIGKIIAWPFLKLAAFVKGVIEFTAVFYEENCPSITIIEED